MESRVSAPAFAVIFLLGFSGPLSGQSPPAPGKDQKPAAKGAEKSQKDPKKKGETKGSGAKGKKAEKKPPPKPSTGPRVILNEILYHPVPAGRKRQFVELHNPNSSPVDLSGWSLAGEVRFTFPPSTRIASQGYLVVGGDPDLIDAAYGLKGTLGPFHGKLAKKGGEIQLLDSKGDLVESVVYDRKPPFPLEAAGTGASLERIHPDFKEGWHWRAGSVRKEWVRVEKTGLLSGGRLMLYLSGEGSCLIDEVRLVPRDGSGPSAVENGGFEEGLLGWDFRGNHTGARVEGQGKEGKGCLRLTASGPGFGGIHSASAKLEGIPPTSAVKLSFWAKGERGSPRLIARIAGEGLVEEEELPVAGGSPGLPNHIRVADLDPWVRSVWHEPARPLPGQPVTVLCRVEDDEAVAAVTLEYSELESETVHRAPMADHGVLESGERAFAAIVPPLPDGAVVRYRVSALDVAGKPAPGEAQRAFYVGKPVPRGKAVGSFDLLVSPAAVEAMERAKATWVQGMAIFDGAVYDRVRVRHRGHSSLGFPKLHFKLRFDGERFEGKRTINLSSSWADKSYLREPLAHSIFAQAGVASCEVKRYARIYLNGRYWGLYYQIEQPGKDYLKRNGRDPDGDLFKCYTSGRPSPTGAYSPSDYQNKTQKEPHYELLHNFLTSMDSLWGAELRAYQKSHLNADDFAGYLTATALVMNSDHVGKNYYLYHDPASDRWSIFPWDLDLTFGRNFECGDPSPLLNDKIRWDNPILFGTEAHPKCDVPGNRLIDKFLSLEENRTLLYKKLKLILKDFTVPGVNKFIRPHYLAIKGEVGLDRQRWSSWGPRNTWDLDFQVKEIQTFVQNRGKFLYQALQSAPRGKEP